MSFIHHPHDDAHKNYEDHNDDDDNDDHDDDDDHVAAAAMQMRGEAAPQ